MDPISRSDLFCMIMTITVTIQSGKGFYERGKNEQLIGGFHLYLSELAFINQFYSIMTRLVWLSLANDYFRNHFTINSKYFDMVC